MKAAIAFAEPVWAQRPLANPAGSDRSSRPETGSIVVAGRCIPLRHDIPGTALSEQVAIIGFRARTSAGPATLWLRLEDRPSLAGSLDQVQLTVDTGALETLCGWAPECEGEWHLSSQLRDAVARILDHEFSGSLAATFLAAKADELLCVTVDQLMRGELLRMDGSGRLSMAVTSRLLLVRQIIDERWDEPWTLDTLARAGGISRAKLVDGFRILFAEGVMEILRSRRLRQACDEIRTTDQPVARIGFRHGYRNGAAFARAFRREFGIAPLEARAMSTSPKQAGSVLQR